MSDTIAESGISAAGVRPEDFKARPSRGEGQDMRRADPIVPDKLKIPSSEAGIADVQRQIHRIDENPQDKEAIASLNDLLINRAPGYEDYLKYLGDKGWTPAKSGDADPMSKDNEEYPWFTDRAVVLPTGQIIPAAWHGEAIEKYLKSEGIDPGTNYWEPFLKAGGISVDGANLIKGGQAADLSDPAMHAAAEFIIKNADPEEEIMIGNEEGHESFTKETLRGKLGEADEADSKAPPSLPKIGEGGTLVPDVATNEPITRPPQSERQLAIEGKFDELSKDQNDPQLGRLAEIAKDVVERDGVNLCFVNGKDIATEIVGEINSGEMNGNVKMWFGEPVPGMIGHAAVIVEANEKIYVVDTVGQKALGLEPGITVISKGETHPVFGNPKIGQVVTESLTDTDAHLKDGRPVGNEKPVTSMDDLSSTIAPSKEHVSGQLEAADEILARELGIPVEAEKPPTPQKVAEVAGKVEETMKAMLEDLAKIHGEMAAAQAKAAQLEGTQKDTTVIVGKTAEGEELRLTAEEARKLDDAVGKGAAADYRPADETIDALRKQQDAVRETDLGPDRKTKIDDLEKQIQVRITELKEAALKETQAKKLAEAILKQKDIIAQAEAAQAERRAAAIAALNELAEGKDTKAAFAEAANARAQEDQEAADRMARIAEIIEQRRKNLKETKGKKAATALHPVHQRANDLLREFDHQKGELMDPDGQILGDTLGERIAHAAELAALYDASTGIGTHPIDVIEAEDATAEMYKKYAEQVNDAYEEEVSRRDDFIHQRGAYAPTSAPIESYFGQPAIDRRHAQALADDLNLSGLRPEAIKAYLEQNGYAGQTTPTGESVIDYALATHNPNIPIEVDTLQAEEFAEQRKNEHQFVEEAPPQIQLAADLQKQVFEDATMSMEEAGARMAQRSTDLQQELDRRAAENVPPKPVKVRPSDTKEKTRRSSSQDTEAIKTDDTDVKDDNSNEEGAETKDENEEPETNKTAETPRTPQVEESDDEHESSNSDVDSRDDDVGESRSNTAGSSSAKKSGGGGFWKNAFGKLAGAFSREDTTPEPKPERDYTTYGDKNAGLNDDTSDASDGSKEEVLQNEDDEVVDYGTSAGRPSFEKVLGGGVFRGGEAAAALRAAGYSNDEIARGIAAAYAGAKSEPQSTPPSSRNRGLPAPGPDDLEQFRQAQANQKVGVPRK